MATELTDTIPCRYYVMKYIPDEMLNEPVNIGIILQSKKDGEFVSHFINKQQKTRNHLGEIATLHLMIERIKGQISQSNENIIETLSKNYEGRILFTEPRGTLAKDIHEHVDTLFHRFIHSTETISPKEIIKKEHMIRKTWNHVNEKYQGNVMKNFPVIGAITEYSYDFVWKDEKLILQTLSFNDKNPLDRTELFDWNAMDAVNSDRLAEENFGALIAKPHKSNPYFDELQDQFEKSNKILESREYHIIPFDTNDKWKRKIDTITSSV